jgi:hypothetical protein
MNRIKEVTSDKPLGVEPFGHEPFGHEPKVEWLRVE